MIPAGTLHRTWHDGTTQMTAHSAALTLILLLGWHATADATDVNIPVPVEALERQLTTEPFRIAAAEISRPKAKGDITLKAEISFSGNPAYRIKLRRAEPGAEDFNNRPRYDLAAYEVQKLFLEPAEFVVPPTALRTLPVSELLPYAQEARPTFRGSDEVLVVLQYWLHEVKVVADVYDPARFASDAGYARNVGQLNLLTYLIEHGDANLGNFLLSRAEVSPRVFSVDNGVAFAYNESDRSDVWKYLRVPSLPADTVARLRALTADDLQRSLGVLAQWRLVDGRWVSEPPGENLAPHRGVRQKDGVVQLGLTKSEIAQLERRRTKLLELVDDDRVGLVEENRP
jgi:hypothetical protein